MDTQTQPSPVKERLLKAAERLFAEKGFGIVSAREITIEAGQKNHSALSYHYGSVDAVLEAILDYRMTPLNDRRAQLLSIVTDEGRDKDLRSLVEVIVKPFADELLRPQEESCYLRLLSQLVSKGEWQSMFSSQPQRASAVLETGELMMQLLTVHISRDIALERLRLFGLHVINTITEWDAMGRRQALVLNTKNLSWRVENLIDYLTAALSVSGSVKTSI